MRKGSPWRTELIEGDPLQMRGRQLVPVVRVRSALRRQVTFGTARSNGGGGGWAWLQPVAVIERRPDGGEKRVQIPDPTWTVLRGMLIGALVLPMLYLLCASLALVWRQRRARGQV